MAEPNPSEERVVEEVRRIINGAHQDYELEGIYRDDQKAALAITAMGAACLKGSLYLTEASGVVMDVVLVGGSATLTTAGLLYWGRNFIEFAQYKARRQN
ncbi:MAG: hypothetical protein QG553_452 [Patescibacteria group bacterium]|nr:hypothetical protein [Patescibacteria group bacterium]